MNPRDVALTRTWADFYRARGWNVLPSDPNEKKPLCRYAEFWESAAPSDLFTRFETTNIQLMTGRYWGLLVIDLDGPEAPGVFASWGSVPRTWVTHSGGNGQHLWFAIPRSIDPMPKAFLWRGDGKHSAIERLCDRSLIMAPPSIHPKTGKRYQFADKHHSPAKLPTPAAAPAWLLARQPIDHRPPSLPVTPLRVPPRARVTAGTYHSRDVLNAIHDKLTLAKSWGVRFNGRVSQTGWAPCHAVGREDRTPSAALHVESGRYVDLGSGTKLGFIDLGIACGAYTDWHQAIHDLGDRYLVRRQKAV